MDVVECVEEDLQLHMFVSEVSVSESLEDFSCQLFLSPIKWFGGVGFSASLLRGQVNINISVVFISCAVELRL